MSTNKLIDESLEILKQWGDITEEKLSEEDHDKRCECKECKAKLSESTMTKSFAEQLNDIIMDMRLQIRHLVPRKPGSTVPMSKTGRLIEEGEYDQLKKGLELVRKARDILSK